MTPAAMTQHDADWWRYCAPYCVWWCRDGRVVLFNRCYEPIAEWSPKHGLRVPASCQNFAVPYEDWKPPQQQAEVDVYEYVHQRWLYSDGSAPWLAGARSGEARIHVMAILIEFLHGKMPKRV